MGWELLDFVGVVAHHDVLADAHGESNQTNNAKHMIIVIEEPGLTCMLYYSLVVDSTIRVWSEELSLLNVRPMNFI